MTSGHAWKLASQLVTVIVGCAPPLVWSQTAARREEGHVQPATSSRLLLVTVPENGSAAYSENHSAGPPQPFNIVGQVLVNASKAATEKALNRLNAEQTPIIAKSLADYDFKSKIVEAAKAMAADNAWLGVAEVTVNSNADTQSTTDAFLGNDFPTLLHLACSYHFPLQFDALVVHCYFAMQVRDGADAQSIADPASSRLANRIFDIYVPLENSYSPPASKNAARWSDGNAALARQALDMANAKLPFVLDTALATDTVPPGTPVRVKRVGHYMGVVANKDATGALATVGGTSWSFEFTRGVGK
jgi:hypothetical protein